MRSSAATQRGQNWVPDFAPHLGERLLDGAGRAVDAGRQHRVERVGDVDDPGAERDLLAARSGRDSPSPSKRSWWWRIAGTASWRKPRRSMIRAPSSAWRCMSAHSSPSRLRRLQEDRIRDRKLADVVEERRVPEQVELGLREPELAADRERELLHASRVAGGVRVARVDGGRQRLHRRGRALARAACLPARATRSATGWCPQPRAASAPTSACA